MSRMRLFRDVVLSAVLFLGIVTWGVVLIGGAVWIGAQVMR